MASPVRESSRRPHVHARRAPYLALAAPVVVGVLLRVWQLPAQVFVGDERWDLDAGLSLSMPEIWTQMMIGRSNFCAPIAAWVRLLAESGVQPSEWMLRLPSLACGLVALVAFPLLARRLAGGPAAVAFAWLVALSPYLVFYSRMMRSYMLLVLVSTLAVLAFLRWSELRDTRAARAYAVLAGMAIYIHQLAAPYVLAPLLAEAAILARRRATVPEWVRLASVGGAAVLFGALFLVPSWEKLSWLLENRSASAGPDWATLGTAALRLAGSPSIAAALLFYGLALGGLWGLARERPTVGAVSAAVVVAGAPAIALLSPLGSDDPIVLGRYLLPALPFLLLWAAAGIARAWQLPGATPKALAVGCVALLVGTGPLAEAEFFQSAFAHRVVHEAWDTERGHPALENARFYQGLREPGAGGPVVELPYQIVLYSETAATHQRIHGQPVKVASPLDAWWDDPRLDLDVHLSADPDRILASDARVVVLHLRPGAEETQVLADKSSYRRKLRQAWNFDRNLEAATRTLAGRLQEQWGEPDYADGWIVAWDLDRVRGSRAGAAGGGQVPPGDGNPPATPQTPGRGAAPPPGPGALRIVSGQTSPDPSSAQVSSTPWKARR